MTYIKEKIYSPWTVMFMSVSISLTLYLLSTLLVEVRDFQLGLILSIIIPAIISFSISFVMLRDRKEIKQHQQKIEEQNSLLVIYNDEVSVHRDIILSQKKELEMLYRNITSSLKAAKHIQGAMLTPVAELQDVLPESFVFLQPKDIVSGDFYWFNSFNQGKQIVFTAVDCVGHGVPGALMSMIGNDLLNEIVIV